MTKKKAGRKGKVGGQKLQAPFRLSSDIVTFLNEVAELSGNSTGTIAEECLWAQLPLERDKYLARKNLIASTPHYTGDHRNKPTGK